MQTPRYAMLNNGAILDVDKIAQIVRKDINEYGVVTLPAGVVIRADSDDVKFLKEMLDVKETPRPEAAAPAIALDAK